MAADSNPGFNQEETLESAMNRHGISFQSGAVSTSSDMVGLGNYYGMNNCTGNLVFSGNSGMIGANSPSTAVGQAGNSSSSLLINSVSGLKHDTGLAVDWSAEEQYKLEEGLIKDSMSVLQLLAVLLLDICLSRPYGARMTLLLSPPSSGKTTLFLALSGKLDKQLKCTEKEKLRIAVLVSQAALQFIHAYTPPEEVMAAGFEICADELGSIVEGHNKKKLKDHSGVEGIAKKLSTSTVNGLSTSEELINKRSDVFGINRFIESPPKGFWVFVWEALQDMTLMILAVCAVVSLAVGLIVEGWPKGAHDGLGIVASIFLVVFVTATSDYRQSLQFKDLDREKKKITVQVTRDGCRQKISIYDLLPGDIVHLAIGDQVPADGLFVSGFSAVVNESSLTGESEPVQVDDDHPFLLSGTKVQDGSFKMLVTTVGMRTQWGKLMAALSEGGDDETPLQVKLNGVATVIGKIGLFFAVITFSVLVQGLFSRKLQDGSHWSWNGDDALEILEYFAIAVTIVVVAVPEGLPLAVTLSLAFAMKKMMNDKALVRHLATCETMGSSTTICSDKTSTLTTNHMTVVKACICGKVLDEKSIKNSPRSELPESGTKILMQSIFSNTGGEIVKNKDNKIEGG